MSHFDFKKGLAITIAMLVMLGWALLGLFICIEMLSNGIYFIAGFIYFFVTIFFIASVKPIK